jgi:hypothetical protein
MSTPTLAQARTEHDSRQDNVIHEHCWGLQRGTGLLLSFANLITPQYELEDLTHSCQG